MYFNTDVINDKTSSVPKLIQIHALQVLDIFTRAMYLEVWQFSPFVPAAYCCACFIAHVVRKSTSVNETTCLHRIKRSTVEIALLL